MRDYGTLAIGEIYTPQEHNDFLDNVETFVKSTGQTLIADKNTADNLLQLAQGVSVYSNNQLTYKDTGSANNFVLSGKSIGIDYFKGPDALFDGMKIKFNAKNANTGACQVDPDGLGNTTLQINGGAIPAALIQPGDTIKAYYDMPADVYEIYYLRNNIVNALGGMLADTTVAFTSGHTQEEISALVDAAPSNLGGNTITFQWGPDDGSANTFDDKIFEISKFYNGHIILQGDTSDNSYATTKDVKIQKSTTSNGVYGLYVHSLNVTTLTINSLEIDANGTVDGVGAVKFENNAIAKTTINFCSFLGTKNVSALTMDNAGNVVSNSSYYLANNTCTNATIPTVVSCTQGSFENKTANVMDNANVTNDIALQDGARYLDAQDLFASLVFSKTLASQVIKQDGSLG